jgi:acetyltransferase-like isoleucine patch superfamily enzyme
MIMKTIIRKIRLIMNGSLKLAQKGGMQVEKGVTVMGGCDFGSEPYLITLRENCRISSDVCFITHDGGTWAFRNYLDEYKDVISYGKIEIGKESFIGARSIIMPGVKIGRNSVVGAGSVVTKDVPDETVVCGVPARKTRTIFEYAAKSKEKMPKDFNKQAYDNDKRKYLMEVLK